MTGAGCDHDEARGYSCGEGVTRWRCPDCGITWMVSAPVGRPARIGTGDRVPPCAVAGPSRIGTAGA